MDKLERLAYWKKIAPGSKSTRPWTNEEEDLMDYFQRFRPDGRGVEKVFEGVNRGEEVLARLLPFYHYTKQGASEDLVFVVRKPQPASEEELREIMTQYLEKVRQIATDVHYLKLLNLLDSIQIQTKRGPLGRDIATPDIAIPEPHFAMIHDTTGDWFINLEPISSDVTLLEEAFYSMCGDYELAQYIMWPIYREATPIEDPFAPIFELWIRGAKFQFTGQVLTVYAPQL